MSSIINAWGSIKTNTKKVEPCTATFGLIIFSILSGKVVYAWWNVDMVRVIIYVSRNTIAVYCQGCYFVRTPIRPMHCLWPMSIAELHPEMISRASSTCWGWIVIRAWNRCACTAIKRISLGIHPENHFINLISTPILPQFKIYLNPRTWNRSDLWITI